jgi:hypothetical protein
LVMGIELSLLHKRDIGICHQRNRGYNTLLMCYLQLPSPKVRKNHLE